MEKTTMTGTSAVVDAGRHAFTQGPGPVRVRLRAAGAGGVVPSPTPATDVAFLAVPAMV